MWRDLEMAAIIIVQKVPPTTFFWPLFRYLDGNHHEGKEGECKKKWEKKEFMKT